MTRQFQENEPLTDPANKEQVGGKKQASSLSVTDGIQKPSWTSS